MEGLILGGGALMAAQRRYPPELIERAVRMVADKRRETPDRPGIIREVGDLLGIHPEALRHWVNKADVDAGARPGTTSRDTERIRQLEKENAELRRANGILKSAAAFFAAELDAYDNALAESTIGLFKTELIKPQGPWKAFSDVEFATAEWIDWYNHHRLHGALDHVTPAEYETAYHHHNHATESLSA
jgi:transposase